MKYRNCLPISTCAALTVAALAAASLACAAETKGPVTDELGVLVIPKGAPIQFGAYWVMSGADSALGIDEQRGVEIAIKDQGGTLRRPSDQVEHRGRRLQRRRRPDRGDEAGREPQHRDRARDPPAPAPRRPARQFSGRPASPTSRPRPRRRS